MRLYVKGNAAGQAIWLQQLRRSGGGLGSWTDVCQISGGDGSGLDADTVDGKHASELLGNNTDVRITAGGARTETVEAMSVGESRQLLWKLQNNTGLPVTITVSPPASGSYEMMCTYITVTGLPPWTGSPSMSYGRASATVAASGGHLILNGIIKRIS